MKPVLTSLIFAITLSASAQDEKEPEQIVSYQVVSDAILRVFPEAYSDFLTVCFIRVNDMILPDQATFMIPDKFFKKSLNQNELDKRAQLLMDQLELSPACQSISFEEATEYAWDEWEDKKVRKVTLTFGIGC